MRRRRFMAVMAAATAGLMVRHGSAQAPREWRHQKGRLLEHGPLVRARTLGPAAADAAPVAVQYTYSGRTRPLYVPRDVQAWQRGDEPIWEDLDTAWYDDGTTSYVGRAYYAVTVDRGTVGYRYQSRAIGDAVVDVRLVALDSQPVTAPTPEPVGNQLWWRDVEPGLDIYLVASGDRVDLRKRLRTPDAPRELTWEISESQPMPLRVQTQSLGQDNWLRLDPTRAGLGPGRTRRQLQIASAVTNDRILAGRRHYTLTEAWTGRTFAIPNPSTRVRVPSTEVSWPIDIDVLVEEEIAADADDGYEYASAWNTSYAAGNNNLVDYSLNTRVGFRFTTVAIPNAATIDNATFAVERASGNTGNQTSDFRASDEDNAAAWSDTNGPTDKTGTTANVTADWAGTAATDVSLNVQAHIAEVTSRAGWSSGNALALYQASQTAENYQYLEDEADADVGAGRLDVNYTAAGGAVVQDVVGGSGIIPFARE